MSYTDDAVMAKLSALNETQESIVTVAQWVMFHRRYADRTGQLWLQRLRDSGSNKRLNLIYLANEVAQQSKARRKDDFLIAFSPIIAEATAIAYKGATSEVQQKLRRVVEVWRQRQIFEMPIQEAIETRIDELDKNRSSGKRGFGEGSLFSKNTGGVPAELSPVVTGWQTVSKLTMSTRTSVNGASQDYDRLTDTNAVTPSAPVHAARLNGLLKTLANAEGAVTEIIKARNALIRDLEQILKSQHDALAAEEIQLGQISERKATIDAKKKDVEDAIMRGFATASNPSTPAQEYSTAQSHSPITPGTEPDRPEVEALTPPTQSPLSPDHDNQQASDANKQSMSAFATASSHQIPSQPLSVSQLQQTPAASSHVGLDLLASLSSGSYQGQFNSNRNGSAAKKRKLDVGDDFPDLGGDAMDDIDDDVAEMLRGGAGS